MMDMKLEPGTGPQGRLYSSLGEFVCEYLVHVYARQVRDVNDTVWCPQWWRHPEAWSRFESLWVSFETLRHGGPLGPSEWWLCHADPHMRKLLDARGPFKYCSVRNGHKNMLTPLPVDMTGAPPELMPARMRSVA